jgi:integrase
LFSLTLEKIMASLTTAKEGPRKGHHRVFYKATDGSRQILYLGAVAKKKAQDILRHVDDLERCTIDGSSPSEATSRWLAEIGDDMRAKLVKHGLARPRQAAPVVTIYALIERFKDRPKWRDKKPSTHLAYEHGFRHILAFFGSHRGVETVTETDAEDMLGYLLEPKPAGAGLAKASAYRMTDTASMLFRFARRSRLIAANPFDEVKRGVLASEHKAFIDAATATLVIDAMKDSQWRLLVALARWGGLRVPSEPKLLRWQDIDWERNRFTVHSPKTEHHHGGESRVVPIFPELRPYLVERFEQAYEGDVYVLPMMQTYESTAYRNQLDRTVRKLGLDRWPRIFHNLRSSRQTELRQQYPGYVGCAWLGNSERVADKHYHQVTESHFDCATHSATQHTPATPRIDPQPKGGCSHLRADS